MNDPLKEAKGAVNKLRSEMSGAIALGMWALASTKAHELSERLGDVAALEGE